LQLFVFSNTFWHHLVLSKGKGMPFSDKRLRTAQQRDPMRGPATVTLAKPRRSGSALPLSPALRAQQALLLKQRLEPHVDGDLEVHVTDNRSVMMSVKRDPRHRRYRLRLHHIFLEAPNELLHEIGRYVVLNARDASKQIGKFIEQNDHRVEPAQGNRRTAIRTRGRFHDLAQIYHDLEGHYFDTRLQTPITWGRNAAAGRRRHSIRLGSYSLDENLIRIHPGLDQSWVPRRYLAWVVFHEMLHVRHPARLVNGRRRFHTNEFIRDEQRYEHYDWARTWEQRNIAALLSL
jgi:hypothetical protein